MPQVDSQLTENKLVLLYTIQQKEKVSAIELSDFIVFKGYMDYFTMQELLFQLENAELVDQEDHVYALTEQGNEVVSTFRSRIPNSVRDEIAEYAKSSLYGRSSMLEAQVEIMQPKPSSTTFEVQCSIRDYDRDVFSLSISVDTEAEAYAVRNRWQQRGLIIYRQLISELKP